MTTLYRNRIEKQYLRIKSLILMVLLVSFFSGLLYTGYIYISFDPYTIKFETISSKMFDRNGVFLWELSKDNSVRNTPVTYTDIPKACVDGIVAIEDKTFWNNIGVDFNGTLRLLFSIFTGGSSGGGSTVTQQVLKTATQRIYNRNPSDKISEIVQSIKLSQTFPKEKILEMYLNNVYFGNLNYGIESASQDYFKKSVKDLNTAECAYIVGIPQWPGVYNPHGNQERGKERQSIVLDAMVREGYINEFERSESLSYDLNFNLSGFEVRAPHFVQFVKDNINKPNTDNLINSNLQYLSEDSLYNALTIETTYDYTLHSEILEKLQSSIKNLGNSKLNNAAVVVLNNQSEVLTMLGSVNFFDDAIDGKFNSALGLRQPGTALNPIVYSNAFENGKKAEDQYTNMPFDLLIEREDGDESIQINNFNGSNINPISLAESLKNNLVIPSVRLTQDLGYKNIEKYINEIRISNVDSVELEGCNQILVLEGCELSLLDLTFVYNILRNNGNAKAISYIEKVSSNSDLLFEHNSNANIKLYKGLNEVSSLLGKDSEGWVKYNGRTVNNKDLFTLGYNDNYVIGVWAGNTKGEEFGEIGPEDVTEKLWEEVMEIINN